MIHLHFFDIKFSRQFASTKIADPASTSIAGTVSADALPNVTAMLQNSVSTVTIVINLLQNILFTSVTSNIFDLKKRYFNIILQKNTEGHQILYTYKTLEPLSYRPSYHCTLLGTLTLSVPTHIPLFNTFVFFEMICTFISFRITLNRQSK